MKRWRVILFIAGLLAVGCTSTTTPTVLPISELPTVGQSDIPLPLPTLRPTEISTENANLSFLNSPEPPTPFVVTSFADFPGNLAVGEQAKEFTASLLGGERFSLAEFRDDYLLVFPTVISCSACMFGINQIAIANETYIDSGLKVLLLDLWGDDDLKNWEYFAGLVDQPNFLWGVVTSESFIVDYNVLGLGTIFLINPAQQIVFRSDQPLAAWQFEELFALTNG